MKVLFLCASAPNPHGASDAAMAYNRVRLLTARGHEVGLAAFLPEDHGGLPTHLETMVHELQLLPATGPSSLVTWLRPSGLPLSAREYRAVYSPDMQKLAGRMVGRAHYEVVVAESTLMAQYIYRNPYMPAVHRVISCQGTVTAARRRSAGLRPWWNVTGWPRDALAHRIETFETGMFRFADRIITTTLQDRLDLLQRSPYLRVTVIPFGMDLGDYQWYETAESEPMVLFAGAFADAAECAGIGWFLREVWPAVADKHPQGWFRIASNDTPRNIRRLAARQPRVAVGVPPAGLEDAFSRARVAVCPVRAPAGIQGHMLRAMASGIPVVSTSAGAEGFPAQAGENILLADTPRTMQAAIDLLFVEPELRRSLSAQARQRLAVHFDWKRSVDALEDVLRRLVD